jgi:hypothetical protein
MVELYRRMTGGSPTQDFIDAVRGLRDKYDLDDDTRVPSWLTDMFSAALKGQETGTVRFEEIGSDADSFLSEVSTLVPGWKHDDQGEWIGIGFSPLGIQIYLSGEAVNDAGTHCCSYAVSRIRAPG